MRATHGSPADTTRSEANEERSRLGRLVARCGAVGGTERGNRLHEPGRRKHHSDWRERSAWFERLRLSSLSKSYGFARSANAARSPDHENLRFSNDSESRECRPLGLSCCLHLLVWICKPYANHSFLHFCTSIPSGRTRLTVRCRGTHFVRATRCSPTRYTGLEGIEPRQDGHSLRSCCDLSHSIPRAFSLLTVVRRKTGREGIEPPTVWLKARRSA